MRLVVPTSRKTAPLCSMISGMRKPSPISINSPRETMTSPPRASAASASSTAAAQLFTTIAASAPVSRSISRAVCTSRLPRAPAARSYSRLEYCVAVRRNLLRQRASEQRRAAKIGVQNHARSVDHRLQGRGRKFSSARRAHALFDSGGAQNRLLGMRFTGGDLAPQSAPAPRGSSPPRIRDPLALHSDARRGRSSSSSTEGTRRSSAAWSAEGARFGAEWPWRHLSTAGTAPAMRTRLPEGQRVAVRRPVFHPQRRRSSWLTLGAQRS